MIAIITATKKGWPTTRIVFGCKSRSVDAVEALNDCGFETKLEEALSAPERSPVEAANAAMLVTLSFVKHS